MKKLLMSLALVGIFAALSAKGDSYMYWMVEQTDTNYSFDKALLYSTAGGEKDQLIGGWMTPGTEAVTKLDATPSYELSGYSIGSDNSFMVELWNDGVFQAQSTLPWASVKDAIYTSTAVGGAATAKFTSFAVPEPTSGLLMLLGTMLLGLKRKRA